MTTTWNEVSSSIKYPPTIKNWNDVNMNQSIFSEQHQLLYQILPATSHDFLGPRSSNSCLLGAFGSKCASAPWPPSGHRPSSCGIHAFFGEVQRCEKQSVTKKLTNRYFRNDGFCFWVPKLGKIIGGCAHPYLKHRRVAMFQHSHLLGRGRDAKIQHGIRQGTWDYLRIVAANDLS